MATKKSAAIAKPKRTSSKRKNDNVASDVEQDLTVAADVEGMEAVEESDPAPKRRKLPVREKDDDAEVEEEPAAEEPTENGSGSDSDSDDAPEAISTSQAAMATRQSAQRASRAADVLSADKKRRRQERNSRLKEQAAKRKAREAEATALEEALQAEADAAALEEAFQAEAEAAAQLQELVDTKTSKLLPLALLESDDEDDEAGEDGADGQGSASRAGQARKAVKKSQPRDLTVGKTVYRVLKDTRPQALAPETSNAARFYKQAMMKRKRVPRPVKKGFLVKQ